MKSLFKIIWRYSLSAGLIIAVILASNAASFLFLGYSAMKDRGQSQNSRERLEAIGNELAQDEKTKEYEVSEAGLVMLEQSPYVWAMGIAPDGRVVWQWKLPTQIPRTYTLQEVASFTRWYLADYPVRVWRSGELLLVFASNPEVESRHSLFMSLDLVRRIPFYIKVLLIMNGGVLLLFILCFGWRFYRTLQPIGEGIERLSQEQPVHLKKKGMAAELADRLNQTSEILQQKSRKLAQRDEARTEWISGISHDIRTPLSLIVGYADRLAESDVLAGEEKEMAKTIQRQSLIIGQLIQDLNLTSKLAYDSQPLRRETCAPSQLLRDCVADLYNEGLNPEYVISVIVAEAAERVRIRADVGLLGRAIRNLIGNSIRHNPKGCTVEVLLSASDEQIACKVCDSGPGIPEEVVSSIDRTDAPVHIMGLRLTAQIAKAHGGALTFQKRPSGNYDAELMIRIS